MTKSIDIEKLVQWALRDELPKGRPVSADIGFAIGRKSVQRPFSMARSLNRVAEVDAFGFVPGAPHEDALIVADAIAALSTSVPIASEQDARHLFGDLAAIAEPILPTLMVSRFNAQALVTSCASMGKRPPWQFEAPTPFQMFSPFKDSNGAVRERPLVYGVDADGDLVALLPNRGRAAKRDGMYNFAYEPRSPLNWQGPSMLHLGECRAEYVAWRAALGALALDLAGKLKEFEPVAPGVAALPWVTGEAPVSRVVGTRDLSGGSAGLPLAPHREAKLRPLPRRAGKVHVFDSAVVAAINAANRVEV